MPPRNPWKFIEGREVFDCPYFRVAVDSVTLAGRERRIYNSVRMKKYGVAVVPIDDEGHTVLVGQYRYVLDRFTWEAIRGGGNLDTPTGDAAATELAEETGYTARHWLKMFEASASPGISDEFAPGYVAWGLSGGVARPNEDELLVNRRLPFDEAVDLALAGGIADLASLSLLLAIDARRRRGDLPADLLALLTGAGR